MRQKIFLYGKGFSDFATRINFIASTSFLLGSENEALWLAAYLMVRQIGALLSSLLVGILANHFHNKSLMIWSDAGCGIVLLAIWMNPTLYTVVGGAFLIGLIYPIYHVNFQAVLPDVFGREALIRVNALLVKITAVISIVGFLTGGILAYQFGFQAVLLFDAFTYFVSLLTVIGLKVNRTSKELMKGNVEYRGFFEFLTKRPKLIPILLFGGFYALAVSGYNYSLPLLAQELGQYHTLWNGMMWSSVAAGSFAGALYFQSKRFDPFYLLPVLAFGFAATALQPFIYMHIVPVMLLLILMGFFEAGVQISYSTILQRTERSYIEKVLAAYELIVRIGFLIGFMLLPLIEKRVPLLTLMFIMNVGLLVFSAWLIAGSRRRMKL